MLNIAIVGTGGISGTHILGYKTYEDRCKIVALADIIPQKAVDKNEYFKLGADVYDSIDGILPRNDIDLVSICTPPYTHAELAIRAMKSGKNVLVEKPMAASLEECDEMLRVAKENGVMLAQVAQNRFRTSVMAMEKILREKKLGKILVTHIDSLWWRGYGYYDLWWRGCWDKEGGGCTLNHAVHHIDMLCWLMGMPDRVTAVLGNLAHDNAEVEDISMAVMQYNRGAMAQVTSSTIHHGEEQRILFQCEKGSIQVPFKVHASYARGNGFPLVNEALEKELKEEFEQFPPLAHEVHAGEIGDVLTALENGTQPLITGEDGRKTVELITAIYKSGSTGQPVDLPLAKDDPFYTVEGILANAVHFYEKKASVGDFADQNITVGSKY